MVKHSSRKIRKILQFFSLSLSLNTNIPRERDRREISQPLEESVEFKCSSTSVTPPDEETTITTQRSAMFYWNCRVSKAISPTDFLAPVISTFGHMPPDNPARLSRPLRNSRNETIAGPFNQIRWTIVPPSLLGSFAVLSNVTSSSIVKRCFTVCPCVSLTSSSLATQSDATYEQSFLFFFFFFVFLLSFSSPSGRFDNFTTF